MKLHEILENEKRSFRRKSWKHGDSIANSGDHFRFVADGVGYKPSRKDIIADDWEFVDDEFVDEWREVCHDDAMSVLREGKRRVQAYDGGLKKWYEVSVNCFGTVTWVGCSDMLVTVDRKWRVEV